MIGTMPKLRLNLLLSSALILLAMSSLSLIVVAATTNEPMQADVNDVPPDTPKGLLKGLGQISLPEDWLAATNWNSYMVSPSICYKLFL